MFSSTGQATRQTPRGVIDAGARSLLDALPAHIAILDAEGGIIATNAAWNRYAARNGFRGEGFGVGHNYVAVCRAASGDRDAHAHLVADGIEAVLAGKATEFELDYECHAPHRRQWFRVLVTPAPADSGASAVVMHVDVSSISHAEEALRSNEGRYRELFKRHPQAMYVCDASTLRFVAVNDAAVARYGYSREEFLGMTLFDLRPADAHDALRQELSVVPMGPRHPGLHRHVRKDGSVVMVDISTHTLEYADRQAFVVLAIDVTERELAESALRDGAARLQALASELEAERARLVAAQAVGKIGSWEFDLATATGRWSEELYRIYGQPNDGTPMTIARVLGWFHPDDRAPAQASFAAGLAQPGEVMESRHRIVLPDGSEKVVNDRFRIQADAAGVPVTVSGTAQDVTEQHRMLDAIQISEERFRLVAKATNESVWDWDMVASTLWWNDGYEAMFGYHHGATRPSLEGWLDRIHPDDRDDIYASITAALSEGRTDWAREYRYCRSDGTYAYVLDRGHILRDEGGRPVRMIGGMRDLSSRRDVEMRLNEQAALLDAAHDAILVKDMDDRIVYWNKGAERLFGWTAEEAIGQVATRLFDVEMESYRAARESLLAHGQWEGELVKHTRDGRERAVDVRWTVVRSESGAPRAVFAITLDVTERKRLEAQFLRAQRLESIGTLAGGIAHDLNNVLAPIMMSIELLKSGETDPERLETLATIESASQRGADMVRQVLSFARGTEGVRQPIDVGLLARDVVKIARETFPKDIAVRLRTVLGPWLIDADATQIHQVLMNMVVNARDAMPHGGTLELSIANVVLDDTYAGMHTESRPGRYLSITVADTGRGIPPEVMERLFEPFFTTKEQGKGTGLGLSTVHTIVRTHGGFVTVYSEPGHGARFVVHLPARIDMLPDEGVPGAAQQLPRGAGELILVVDDEEPIREIVRKTLERFGYEVIVAVNGAEAVARYVQHDGRVAAVLTDMAMPVMDGPAMVIALRALDPAARIIGSSGMLTSDKLAHLSGQSSMQFVHKPYTAEALLTTLHRVLHETA
ncbi:MAG: PAS domain S-box protein [Gemmatimonadaceae bacterium]|nr:PAS domain S-box protein [Gemmatimonadaceae bacterium]